MAKNITISVDEELLRQVKEYARERGQSVNSLIKEVLERAVGRRDENPWVEFLRLGEELQLKRNPGETWSREDLYDR